MIKEGFKDDKIIAKDTRQANHFLGQIIYHVATYYQGLTIEIANNEKVYIKPKDLTDLKLNDDSKSSDSKVIEEEKCYRII